MTHSALWAVFIAILLAGCSEPVRSESRAGHGAAIRQADAAWLEAIAAKQRDATVSFYVAPNREV